MRISLNWLRDYLDIKADVDVNQIAQSLTMAGLEVESIDYIKEKARRITLAHVLEKCSGFEPENIYLVESEGEQFRVKAFSPNIIPETIIGIIMNDGENNGFRVAEYADLGFNTAHHEPICFPKDFINSSNLRQLADLPEFDDVIFLLGVTPNRPDALSHLGVSRELAALLDLAPRVPILSGPEMAGPTHEKAVVEIDDSNDCPRYALRVIENIEL